MVMPVKPLEIYIVLVVSGIPSIIRFEMAQLNFPQISFSSLFPPFDFLPHLQA